MSFSPKERKERPLASGVLDYFPDALLEVAHVSYVGNEQHNPGEPLHWAKHKSTDEADALLRHLAQRGGFDSDGLRHTAKVAWRALALLQRELDAVKGGMGQGIQSGTQRSPLPLPERTCCPTQSEPQTQSDPSYSEPTNLMTLVLQELGK